MNKKIKLIIEISAFVIVFVVIALVYNFNGKNKEEVKEEAVSVGVVKITDENFESEILNSELPVILDFSSNSCPPCVAVLTTLIDIAKNNKDIKVATLNVDSEECEEIIKKYPIEGTPTLMIFESGKVTSTLIGAMDADKILSEIDK